MKGGDILKKLKLKSDIPQKIGKFLLWTLILFLLFRGIGSVFKQSDSMTAKDVINEYTKTMEQNKKMELEAAAFAQGFVTEYLTYSGAGSSEDYTNRTRKYLAGFVELTQVFTGDARAEVTITDAVKVEWVTAGQINIDIRAKVKYTQKAKQEATKQELTEKITLSDLYLRVPVAIKNSMYVVEDIPAFIPTPEKAAVKFTPYTAKELNEEQSKEVKTMLENFFKTYYAGTTGEIAYYLANSETQLKGLEKRFELIKIDNASAFINENTGSIEVIVALTIKDSINGQQMPQKYSVELARKDNRLYVVNFDVRTGNIN